MGTPILTPDWIHKAWEHKDNMYVCTNRKNSRKGLIFIVRNLCSLFENTVSFYLAIFKVRIKHTSIDTLCYQFSRGSLKSISISPVPFPVHMFMPACYLCWEGWCQPSACSNFHAGDEEFRMAFKVPPFQDCVLSFLGFSEEEKSNMEERTLKHGTKESSLNLLSQLLLTTTSIVLL